MIGIVGAVGAMGGFLIPIAFGSPWVDDPLAAAKRAFLVFTAFYVVCAGGHLASTCRKPASRLATSGAVMSDRHPLPVLRAAVRHEALGAPGARLEVSRGRSSRPTRARCAARAGRRPGCAATASG